MPLSDFRRGTGERVHQGQTGVVYQHLGAVRFLIAPHIGIDASLFAALKWLADDLRIVIVAGSIDTGKHVEHSRHSVGCAADLVEMYREGQEPLPVTLANPYAKQVVRACLGAGWHIGEGGDFPGIILGPPHSDFNPTETEHRTHCHISVARPFAR